MQSSETVVDGFQSPLNLKYWHGFGNEFASECLPGALPVGRNTPRQVPYQLYTEQLSGSAFTAPRHTTKRTWLYRMQPSVATSSSSSSSSSNNNIHSQRLGKYLGHCPPRDCQPVVDALRWKPLQPPEKVAPDNTDFWDSLHLQCHAGDPALRQGLAIYQYASSPRGFGRVPAPDSMTSMTTTNSYCNADGDFLIVPHQGTLLITTELGRLTVGPTEICVIPRGMVYSVVSLLEDETETSQDNDNDNHTTTTTSNICAGYVLEIYSCIGFQLPELGPIGANGLANPRDFLHPVAWCVTDRSKYHTPHTIITKQHSELFARPLDHSPYNVVAWHGNYLPYKYNLQHFCAVNSVTYDHLDPSLYTVLTCPSHVAGTALADFVIFPPRVLATDANTLRPPWFHRNVMSEYMGLIYGQYDAKQGGEDGKDGGAFVPGGSSLHNNLTPHGPDAVAYFRAVADPCPEPKVLDQGMAFMFETCLSLAVAPRAVLDDDSDKNGPWRRDICYAECWQDLHANDFNGWDAFEQQRQLQQQRDLQVTEQQQQQQQQQQQVDPPEDGGRVTL